MENSFGLPAGYAEETALFLIASDDATREVRLMDAYLNLVDRAQAQGASTAEAMSWADLVVEQVRSFFPQKF